MSASLGKAIDEIAKLQRTRDALKIKVVTVEKEIIIKKEKLLKRVKRSDLDGARGKLGLARIEEDDHPSVGDFSKIVAYVKKNNAFDLFQKRISKEAYTLRVAEGEKIPGVTLYHSVKLVVSASKS